MMRELSQLLVDLYDGLCAIQAREGVRLSGVEMTLPIAVRPVLQEGGCVLQAEFVRGTDPEAWTQIPSRLRLGWTDTGASTAGDDGAGADEDSSHAAATEDAA